MMEIRINEKNYEQVKKSLAEYEKKHAQELTIREKYNKLHSVNDNFYDWEIKELIKRRIRFDKITLKVQGELLDANVSVDQYENSIIDTEYTIPPELFKHIFNKELTSMHIDGECDKEIFELDFQWRNK